MSFTLPPISQLCSYSSSSSQHPQVLPPIQVELPLDVDEVAFHTTLRSKLQELTPNQTNLICDQVSRHISKISIDPYVFHDNRYQVSQITSFDLNRLISKNTASDLINFFRNLFSQANQTSAKVGLKIILLYETLCYFRFEPLTKISDKEALNSIYEALEEHSSSIKFDKIFIAVTHFAKKYRQDEALLKNFVVFTVESRIVEAFFTFQILTFVHRVKNILRLFPEKPLHTDGQSGSLVPLYIFAAHLEGDIFFKSILKDSNILMLQLYHDGYAFRCLIAPKVCDIMGYENVINKLSDQYQEMLQNEARDPVSSYQLLADQINKDKPDFYCLKLPQRKSCIFPLPQEMATPPPPAPSFTEPQLSLTPTIENGPDTILTLKRLANKLVCIVNKEWLENFEHKKAFIQMFEKQQGIWHFDVSDPVLVKAIYEPLVEFISTRSSTDHPQKRLLLLEDLANGLHLYQSRDIPVMAAHKQSSNRKITFQSYLKEQNRQQIPSEVISTHGLLSPEQASKVCETFFMNKIAECKLQLLNIKHPSQTTQDERKVLPFFLISNQGFEVAVDLYTIHHDGTSFTSIFSDQAKISENYLKNIIGEFSSNPITYQQYSKLVEHVLNNDSPTCLVLKKWQIAQEHVQTPSQEVNGYPPSSNTTTKTHSSDDLRKSRSSPTHNNVTPQNREKSVAQNDIPDSPVDLKNTWLLWMQNDVKEVAKTCEIQLEKTKVEINSQTFDFAFLRIAKQLPRHIQPIACFNSWLKSYQRNAIDKAWHCQNHGLGFIFAHAPGLGKSFTGFETICQMITKYKTGHHIVIVPLSLLDTAHYEYKKALLVSQISALRVWLTKETTDSTKRRARVSSLTDAIKFLLKLQQPPKEISGLSLKLHLQTVASLLKHDISFTFAIEQAYLSISLDKLKVLFQEHSIFLQKQLREHPECFKSLSEELQTVIASIVNLPLASSAQSIARSLIGDIISGDSLELISVLFAKTYAKDIQGLILLTAKLLRIDPNYQEDPHDAFQHSQDSLDSIIDFSESLLIATHDAQEFEQTIQAHQSSIIITTSGALRDIDFSKHLNVRFLSLLVDEAQKIKNSNTNKNRVIFTLACHIRKTAASKAYNPLILCLSGTPITKAPQDLWNLLSIVLPESFRLDNYTILETYLRHAYDALGASNHPNLSLQIIRAFLGFTLLKNEITRRFVSFVKHDDREVKQAWNEMIPSAQIITRQQKETLPSQTVAAIKTAFLTYQKMKFTDDSGLFTYQHSLNRYLLHPDLTAEDRITTAETKEKVQAIERRIENATQNQLPIIINESPILQAFFSTPELEPAIHEHKNILVIVDQLATGQILKTALDKKFSKMTVTKMFDGTIDRIKKASIVDWHNQPTNNHSKIIVLTIGAGGVGLNLHTVELIIDLAKVWDPTAHEQARRRGLRPGFKGHKPVIVYNFGTYFEHLLQAIWDEKLAWQEFFWPTTNQSQVDSLKSDFSRFLSVLRKMIHHNRVLKNSNNAFASLEMPQEANLQIRDEVAKTDSFEEIADANLTLLQNRVTEIELQRFFQLAIWDEDMTEVVEEQGVV